MKKATQFVHRYLFDILTLKIASLIMTVVLLVGGVLLYAAYFLSAQNIRQSAIASSQQELKELVNVLDANLKYAENIALNLSVSKEVRYLSTMNYMDEKEKINRVMSMTNRLSVERNSNEIINSVYLYYPHLEAVIYDALYRAQDVEDINNLKLHTEKQLLLHNENTRFSHYTDAGAQNLLQIIKPVFNAERGWVVVNIDVQMLSQLIKRMTDYANKEILLMDTDGTQLLYTGKTPLTSNAVFSSPMTDRVKLDGTEYLALQHVSDYSGWTIVSLQPYEDTAKGYTSLKMIIPVFALIALALGCVLSVAVTMRISKPINMLYYSVTADTKQKQGKQDHLQYLLNSYEGLQNANLQLRKGVHLRELLLSSPQEMKGEPSGLARQFPHTYFLVVVTQLSQRYAQDSEVDYLKMGPCRQLMQSVLSKLPNKTVTEIIQVELARLAVIINYDGQELSEDVLFHMLTLLNDTLRRELNLAVYMGIGRRQDSPMHLYRSYAEAMQALEYRFIAGNEAIIYFDSINFDFLASEIRYPAALERELLEGLRFGDRNGVEESLQGIYSYVQQLGPSHPLFMRQVWLSVINAVRQEVFKLLPEQQAVGLMGSYQQQCELLLSGDSSQSLNHTQLLCDQVIQQMEILKNQKNELTVQQILQYMEQNYTQELTVDNIAASFHISSSYCYRLLKEQRKLSPASYLADIRVKKAQQLLDETAMPVKDISNRCGFESLQIFYRQFKRKFGVSPSEYRKQNKE